MATGASTADVAILLVDARHGVRVAVAAARADRAAARHHRLRARRQQDGPGRLRPRASSTTSATSSTRSCRARTLHADSAERAARRQRHHAERPHAVVRRAGAAGVSSRRSRSIATRSAKPFRFPVQLVLRPDHEFRGYAGQIVVGHRPRRRHGHGVAVRPLDARQADRHLGRRPRRGARADVGDADARGRDRHQPRRHAGGRATIEVGQRFEADVVWMDERPLDPARVYLLKHTTRTVTAEVDHGAGAEPDRIGDASRRRGRSSSTATRDNRGTGSFILIDPATNFTAGAGMIIDAGPARMPRRRARGRAPPSGWHAARARRPRTEAEAVDAVRQRARGAAAVIDGPPSIVASRARSRGETPCVTSQLPGRGRRAGRTCSASCGRTSRCCSSRRCTTSPQTLAYRDEIAARWKLNLVNLRAAEPSVGLWQTSTDDCCARHKVGPLFARARRLRHLVHRAAARAVAVARQPGARRAVRAAERQDAERRSARWRRGRRGTSGSYAKAHDIPLLPLYELGLLEHRLRAVHVAAARPVEPAIGPLAGPEARVRDPYSACRK